MESSFIPSWMYIKRIGKEKWQIDHKTCALLRRERRVRNGRTEMRLSSILRRVKLGWETFDSYFAHLKYYFKLAQWLLQGSLPLNSCTSSIEFDSNECTPDHFSDKICVNPNQQFQCMSEYAQWNPFNASNDYSFNSNIATYDYQTDFKNQPMASSTPLFDLSKYSSQVSEWMLERRIFAVDLIAYTTL